MRRSPDEIVLDRIIYVHQNGKTVKHNDPRTNPDASNFLIVSHFGDYDWSGFLPLDECLVHMSRLEGLRPDGYYRTVER